MSGHEDLRTVDELVRVAVTQGDDDRAWAAVVALHWRGTAEVLARARSLCDSPVARERRTGADILGQLGVPERSFPRECGERLLRMLDTERDPDVLQATLVGLHHLGRSDAVRPSGRFADHASADVRHAAALALSGHDDPLAIETLIRLTTDADNDVRDWATFGLGSQCGVDTPEVREALAARLADRDDETRGEAMVGLARRGDPRAIAAVQKELAAEQFTRFAIEAAELAGSPELLPLLHALREHSGVPAEVLERAIDACSAVRVGCDMP